MVQATRPWTSFESAGSVQPRLSTPPLLQGPPGPCGCGCALTPETSYGFDVIDFAKRVLKEPLDPWQEWLVIHAGELMPDETPRFRQVLVLVARQNGKTHVLKVLGLFWLYIERVGLVLGTSTNLDYAKESWEKAVLLAEDTPALTREIKSVRRANGEQTLTVAGNGRYKIAASNRRGGRSLTVHRLIMDELREHHDWSAYNAAAPATSAVPSAQIWMITNQGDEKSVVLQSLRAQALSRTDPRLGIFEWSAPDGAAPTDVEALAAANPNLGHRINLESLMGDAIRAEAAGGDQLAGFLTEHQCRYVPMLNPAIDSKGWFDCLDPATLDGARGRLALCLDVSPDLRHATLYAAGLLEDGRARVEPVAAWSGQGCTDQLRSELGGLVAKVDPAKLGWFPSGPAAALAADLRDRDGWPPAGVEIEEIRGDVAAVCMGFAEQDFAVIFNVLAHMAGVSGLPRSAARERTADALRHVGLFEERYREMMECLPPAAYRRDGFLVGEPQDHDAETGEPRYEAFIRRGFWGRLSWLLFGVGA